MLLSTLPDESHNGDINNPPIDGETMYILTYIYLTPQVDIIMSHITMQEELT